MNKIDENGVKAQSRWLLTEGNFKKENVRFFMDISSRPEDFFELIRELYEMEGNYEKSSY